MTHPPRTRLTYAALLLLTIAGGLASRALLQSHPNFVTTYGGDVLWAAMVYWLVRLAFPRAFTPLAAAVALGIAAAVEFSQLYRAEWMVALRATTLGALALGHGFLWSDLICYAAGIGGAVILDVVFVTRARVECNP